MTALHIVQQRLHNQRLIGAPFTRPDEAVWWFGAVQAQEYPGAAWGVAQRSDSLTQAAIDRAFADGALLRTHAMRPTWHFVAPADIRWLLKLTSPRVHAANATYYRKLELDTPVLTRSAGVLASAVEGGKHLTRNELAAALEQAGIIRAIDDRMRLTYLVMHAELEGLICSGAMRGKQHTYALLDERAPAAKALARDEALAELTRRYFTSHGPATAKDFAWWSGLAAADVRAGLELSRSQLEMARVDGHVYWFGLDARKVAMAAPIAHLLPAYDEFTIAYKDHTAILDAGYRDLVVAAFGTVIVIDGQIVGAWKRVIEKDRVLLTLSPFRALTEAEDQALSLAVQRYSAFLGKPVALA
ncbi:MAG: AlkZ family DNA glycosylase [Kouleothrix sp.]|nr:AlkZ family DNA glycosylase [Kouleothrix sp.]